MIKSHRAIILLGNVSYIISRDTDTGNCCENHKSAKMSKDNRVCEERPIEVIFNKDSLMGRGNLIKAVVARINV